MLRSTLSSETTADYLLCSILIDDTTLNPTICRDRLSSALCLARRLTSIHCTILCLTRLQLTLCYTFSVWQDYIATNYLLCSTLYGETTADYPLHLTLSGETTIGALLHTFLSGILYYNQLFAVLHSVWRDASRLSVPIRSLHSTPLHSTLSGETTADSTVTDRESDNAADRATSATKPATEYQIKRRYLKRSSNRQFFSLMKATNQASEKAADKAASFALACPSSYTAADKVASSASDCPSSYYDCIASASAACSCFS
jgi:hypothetical protein